MLARLRALAAAGLAGAVLAATPLAAQSNDDPLPRFEKTICPGVAGLALESAEAMVERIRANLAAFGRKLAAAGCDPNLAVLFVDDTRGFLERLEQRTPWLFDTRAERARTLAEPGPARAVLRVEARSRDGQPIATQEDLVNIPTAGMWMAHSKIYTSTRNDIVSAMILFDRTAAERATVGQLADYATFRALTRALPQTPGARSASILSLFDEGAERPAGLTEFDRTFLEELYDGAANVRGTSRLAALEKATGRDVFSE